MQIRQALGVSRTRAPDTIEFLTGVIEDLKASGFIRDALRRSGQDSALVAPPGQPGLSQARPRPTVRELFREERPIAWAGR